MMPTVHAFLAGFFASLIGMTVWHFARGYYVAQGTVWQRVLATSRESATWLWAKLLLVAGALLSLISQLADLFNMPDVQNFIREQVPVQYVGYALLAIALMTFISRARSLCPLFNRQE